MADATAAGLVAVPKPRVHQKDPGYLAWLRTQPCWVCANIRVEWMPVPSAVQALLYTGVDAAHVESRRYGDVENAIPLCRMHHLEGKWSFHRLGRKVFESHYKVTLVNLAHEYYWRYLQWKAQAAW